MTSPIKFVTSVNTLFQTCFNNLEPTVRTIRLQFVISCTFLCVYQLNVLFKTGVPYSHIKLDVTAQSFGADKPRTASVLSTI